MKAYAIIRYAVYDHGMFGVYSTLKLARLALKRAYDAENDDYHDFRIEGYNLDTDVNHDKKQEDEDDKCGRSIGYYPKHLKD